MGDPPDYKEETAHNSNGSWEDDGGLYGCTNDMNSCLLFTCEPFTLGAT